MMSGRKAIKFKSGWAVIIAQWGRAHYFQRDEAGICQSLCGRAKAVAAQLYLAGTWKHCKLCEKADCRRTSA